MTKENILRRPKNTCKDEMLRGYEYQLARILDLEQRLELALERSVDEYLNILDIYKEAVEEGARVKIKTMAYLDTVKNKRLRAILQLTYIDCLDIKEISKKLGFSLKPAQRWQDQAVELVKIKNVEGSQSQTSIA